MNIWLILIVIGLITFAIRLSFIALWGRIVVPPALQRGLRFVPPAVLSAIILPEVVLRDNQLALTLANGRLIAGVVAVLVAWRTRSALLTIAAGMIVLWLVQLV